MSRKPIIVAIACRGAYAIFVGRLGDSLVNTPRAVGPRRTGRPGPWLTSVIDQARVTMTLHPGAWPSNLAKNPDLTPAYLAMIGPRPGQGRSDYPPLVAGAILTDDYCHNEPWAHRTATRWWPGQGWLASRSILVPPYPHNPRSCPDCIGSDPASGEGYAQVCGQFVKYGRRDILTYPPALIEETRRLPADAHGGALIAWDIAAKAASLLKGGED